MGKGAKEAGVHNEGNVIVNNSKEEEKYQQKKPICLHKKLSEDLKPKENRNIREASTSPRRSANMNQETS